MHRALHRFLHAVVDGDEIDSTAFHIGGGARELNGGMPGVIHGKEFVERTTVGCSDFPQCDASHPSLGQASATQQFAPPEPGATEACSASPLGHCQPAPVHEPPRRFQRCHEL